MIKEDDSMRTVLIEKTEFFPIFEAGLFGENKSSGNKAYYRRNHAKDSQVSEFAERLKSEIKFMTLS